MQDVVINVVTPAAASSVVSGRAEDGESHQVSRGKCSQSIDIDQQEPSIKKSRSVEQVAEERQAIKQILALSRAAR